MHVRFNQISSVSFAKPASTSSKVAAKPLTASLSEDKESNMNDHFTSSLAPGLKVVREVAVTPLRWSDHRVRRKDGSVSTVGEVISSSPTTLMLFGSPSYPQCLEMAHRLRAIEDLPEVIYVPVYTYRETVLRVEQDFQDNHGDWWTMDFQSLGAVEAMYMCGAVVLPTVMVVNRKGVVVSGYGQLDLDRWGDGAVIAWS